MNPAASTGIRKAWQWLKPMIIVAMVLLAFRSAVADWNDVPTGSMNPVIVEGDRIFVNKLAYNLRVPFTDWQIAAWSRPARGEVVVFHHPETGTRMVKRVIGLPGETIEMRDNVLWIDGEPVEYAHPDAPGLPLKPGQEVAIEPFGDMEHPVLATPGIPARRSFGPIAVPQGHYFLMGDNRDVSLDSRFFGPVPADRIVGRSGTVVFSLNRDRSYMPRKDRFFRGIP